MLTNFKRRSRVTNMAFLYHTGLKTLDPVHMSAAPLKRRGRPRKYGPDGVYNGWSQRCQCRFLLEFERSCFLPLLFIKITSYVHYHGLMLFVESFV